MTDPTFAALLRETMPNVGSYTTPLYWENAARVLESRGVRLGHVHEYDYRDSRCVVSGLYPPSCAECGACEIIDTCSCGFTRRLAATNVRVGTPDALRKALAVGMVDALAMDWPGDTRLSTAPAIVGYLLSLPTVRAALAAPRAEPEAEAAIDAALVDAQLSIRENVRREALKAAPRIEPECAHRWVPMTGVACFRCDSVQFVQVAPRACGLSHLGEGPTCALPEGHAGYHDWVPERVRESAPRAERVTHGRHCRCTPCAAQDWTLSWLAPCGMHGPSCPPVYAPYPKAAAPRAEPEAEAAIDAALVDAQLAVKESVRKGDAPRAEAKCEGCEVCIGEEDDCGCIIGHEHTCSPRAKAAPTPLDVCDNQAALESLPVAVQGADLNLPARVVVDQHGHYWRDYGDFLSMCPVSEENVATEVVAAFARLSEARITELEAE